MQYAVAKTDTSPQNSQPEVYCVGRGAAVSELYGLAITCCECLIYRFYRLGSGKFSILYVHAHRHTCWYSLTLMNVCVCICLHTCKRMHILGTCIKYMHFKIIRSV